MDDKLHAQIEAVLFFKGEPVSISWLSRVLQKDKTQVLNAIQTLESTLTERGIVLIKKDNQIALRTSSKYSDLLTNIRKEELSKDLGKAKLETLSIVLYRGPVTRANIDYIRGVNSTFILRSLLIRGLVEKIPNPKDARGFLYRPTFELLSLLGISKINELPDYEKTQEEIKNFETSQGQNDKI